MFTANNRSYGISIRLFWGSTGREISSASSTKNYIMLEEKRLESFSLTSSLLVPWLYGNFIYSDDKRNSKLINLIDAPIIYGQISFCQYDGAGSSYSAETIKPFKPEVFSETVIIDSFSVVKEDDNTMTFSFKFSMEDSVAFNSSLNPVSTFTDKEKTMKLKNLVKELFAASNTSSTFDYSTIKIDADIPFISSPNSTFMNSIEYVYRKIFDSNFENRNGKDFCKVVYNNGERKYELWRFGDIGTKAMFKCNSTDAYYKNLRENIAVTVIKDSAPTPNSASFINTGNARDLHSIFGDKTFVSYDYLKNSFNNIVDTHADTEFSSLKDGLNPNKRSKAYVAKMHSVYSLELDFSNQYSTYRDNGSLYDVFNNMIFDSSCMRVTTLGCLGRYAGSGIALSFKNADMTPYKHLGGNYVVTGITHNASRNGDEWEFMSIMDVYSPFMESDSIKNPNY